MRLGDPMPDIQTRPPEDRVALRAVAAGWWSVLGFYPPGLSAVTRHELASLAAIRPELERRGIRPLLFLPETPARIFGALDALGRETGQWVAHPVLSDSGGAVRAGFGLPPAAATPAAKHILVFSPGLALRSAAQMPATLGLSRGELLRALDALMLLEHGECAAPPDWQRGRPLLSID